LLYYYCFLNLGKAVLGVRGLQYDTHHGLSPKVDSTSPDLGLQSVKVFTKGVFPAFYEQQVKAALPTGIHLSIKTLLGYVGEVASQYQAARLGSLGVFHDCHARMIGHEPSDKGWWTIAVPFNYDFSALPEPNRSTFEEQFEEVAVPKAKAREEFGIFAADLSAYRFYQSRMTASWNAGISRHLPLVSLFGSMDGYIEPKYVDTGSDFTLCRPYPDATGPFRMSELLAIYLVMFYLGSLVRYRPDYFDDLLETRSAWVLESFVTSAPLAALRMFVSKITDKVYLFNK